MWWQCLFPAGAVAVAGALFVLRRRIGRGPLAAVLIFAGTLLPALGFFSVAYHIRYSFVADHFLYLSAVPLLALIVSGLARAVERLGRRGAPAGLAVAGCVLVAFGVKTWALGGNYRDPMVLWQTTARQNPDSAIVHCNLGHRYMVEALKAKDRGKMLRCLDQAECEFRRSLELDEGMDPAYTNLGYLFGVRGDLDRSTHYYSEAIRINPRGAGSYLSRAENYRTRARRGDLARALSDCDRAVGIDPRRADAWGNRGLVLADMGRYEEALVSLNRSLALDPIQPRILDRRGAVYGELGRYNRALRDLDRAIRLDPKLANAYRNRAAVLNRVGRPDRAMEDLRTYDRLGGQIEPALLREVRARQAAAGGF